MVDEYLKKIEDNDAGEIDLFDVDNDGMMKGYPLKTYKDGQI